MAEPGKVLPRHYFHVADCGMERGGIISRRYSRCRSTAEADLCTARAGLTKGRAPPGKGKKKKNGNCGVMEWQGNDGKRGEKHTEKQDGSVGYPDGRRRDAATSGSVPSKRRKVLGSKIRI